MHQLLAYIYYWLHAVNEHSLHSPFLYEFYQDVVANSVTSDTDEIEKLRFDLLSNNEFIEVEDLGAGSKRQKSNKRKIRQIARDSSTPPKFSKLIYRLIQKYNPESILELGTSLGLNTLYMSRACNSKIHTFEGSEEIASLAKKHFEFIDAQNIEIIIGNIDNTLPAFLSKLKKIDLVYIDANHRYTPTLNYFEQISAKVNKDSIVIIDDIHWSKEMKMVWGEIKKKPDVTVSLDLFEAGILFFNPNLPKTDLVLKF